MNARWQDRLGVCVAALLVLAYLVQGLVFVLSKSQTYDEAVHLAAGYSYLARRDFRLNREHPPLVKLLAALPVYLRYRLAFTPSAELWRRAEWDRSAQWEIGREFLYRSGVAADRLLGLARLPNLVLGAVVVIVAGWWSYRLWGRAAGLVAMGLAVFDPNLIAHGSLVTTDLAVTLFAFAAMYLAWEYMERPGLWLFVALGVSMGLALSAKYSAVLLVGIGCVAIGAEVVCGGSVFALPGTGRRVEAGSMAGRVLESAAALYLVLWLAVPVVLGSYFFQGWSSWWYGLQEVLAHQDRGHAAFLMGSYSRQGWWYYFPVAFLIKTPAGTLVLVAAGLVFFRAGRRLGRRQVFFVLLPALIYFAAMTRARINIGLRYLLPAYPFLFVLASRLATVRWRRQWMAPAVLCIPVLFNAVSVLRAAPHYLAYFNELIGGPENGHLYLSDSNLDWGQDLEGLRRYMEREALPTVYLSYFGTADPAGYGIGYQYVPAGNPAGLPRPGPGRLPAAGGRQVLAISVTNLQGVYFDDKDLYGWLSSRRPAARIGYSMYIYDLTRDAEGRRRLAQVCRRHGLKEVSEQLVGSSSGGRR